MKKFLILLIIVSVTSSCRTVKKYLPNKASADFKSTIATGSIDFQNGWRDGCETGMSSAGNTFYKMFYDSNSIDGFRYTESADYSRGWTNAFWYCYRADAIKQASSVWGSMFGGYR
jgi:hypothetical protein